MRVGVLSDTHIGPGADTTELDRIVSRHFRGIDVILHAGDLTHLPTLEAVLGEYQLIAVCGNMDDALTGGSLPVKRVVNLGGKRIGMMHGWGAPDGVADRVAAEFSDVDCIVFGHSHRPLCETKAGVLMFNPGSPTDRRFAPSRSIGVLEINDIVTGKLIPLGE